VAEIHEIKLKVTVDKDTKELKLVNGELSDLKLSQEQLTKMVLEGGQAVKKTDDKMVNWKTTMKVLLGTFGVGFIANFFKSATLEAAKYDVASTKALNNSDRVFRNLKDTIGQGFLPVLKLLPGIVNTVALGFGRLRQGIEILMGGLGSLINKNIKYSDEVKLANERYQQFVKDVVQGEMHLSKETEKLRNDLTDKVKQLTLNKFEYERQKLKDEVTAAKEAGVDAQLVAKYNAAALKDISKREAEDIRAVKEQNDIAYAELQQALSDKGLKQDLAAVDTRVAQQLAKNAKLMASDKKYTDQSGAIHKQAETEKSRIAFEALSKKLGLEKLTSSTVDLLVTSSADKQKEMVWNIVKEEASGYAKRMMMAAALAVAQGNWGQAALAGAQVAIAIGVARFADGEAEKVRIEAENNRIREEEQIKLQEQKLGLEQDAADESTQIQDNQTKYEYENGKISADVYIAFLKKKQQAFKAYTDSWMSVQNEIDTIEKDRVDAIQEQTAASTALRGSITGSSVSTEQKTVTNYITITLPIQVLDLNSVSESALRDLATKLWGYLNQQLTGRG
jgi:hypothetical protein